MSHSGTLPATLPQDPMPLFDAWYREARRRRCSRTRTRWCSRPPRPDGTPAARVVLCKKVVADPGYVVFFTNYDSRKGQDLAANPRVAGVLHWDSLSRQVRLEGRVVLCPPQESDEYFSVARDRQPHRRVGKPAEPAARFARDAAEASRVEAARHGTSPRVRRTGAAITSGSKSVELWCEGAFRVHDRARWTARWYPSASRTSRPAPGSATRVYP